MASSSNNTDKDSELLFVGQQCSEKTCHLVDFLPFKCDHCSKAYCGEHFLPLQHSCEKYDAMKFDRVAPPCPLCHTPIAIPPNEDPNIRMGQHLDACAVITGRKITSSTPRCANMRCKKVIHAPIKCDACRKQFCAEHRFPGTHNCVQPTPSSTAPKPSPAAAAISNPLEKAKASMTKTINAATPQAAAGLAAVKRAVESKMAPKAKEPTSATASSGNSSAGPSKTPVRADAKPDASSKASHNNPFSKTDRRAKAEDKSRKIALRERAKKGLLSEQEKKVLAEMEANGDDDNKDKCVVM